MTEKIKLSEIERIADHGYIENIKREEIKAMCKAVRAAKYYYPWNVFRSDSSEKMREALSAFEWGDDG